MRANPNRELESIEESVGRVLKGKREAIRLALACLLAKGHLLIEDVPGVGKTTLSLALARSINCSFQRIQFTSDLLPSDITGVSIYNPETRAFEFRPGPVFANIVLADEINRASPKTQSALLEAMGERQVSSDGKTFTLPEPFMVIATQNPIEYHGTFPLPESQMDRFLMRISLGYPGPEEEKEALRELNGVGAARGLGHAVDAAAILRMQKEAASVKVDGSLLDYVLAIVQATRDHPGILLGASTRGAQFLLRAAMARAYSEGRDFTAPDDIKKVAGPVLSHRIIQKTGPSSPPDVVSEILERTPVPL